MHKHRLNMFYAWCLLGVAVILIGLLFASLLSANAAAVDEYMIVTNDNGDVWYFKSNMDGTFEARTKVDTIGPNARCTCIADFDNDGDSDFIAADSTGVVFLFNNTGGGAFNRTTVASGLGFGTGPYAMDAAVGRFNSDNYQDFVLSGVNNTFFTFINNGNLTFSRTYTTVSWASNLRGKDAGDFNGDGYTDFAVGRQGGEVYLYEGNGTGNFSGTPAAVSAMVDNLYSLASGDFNKDGKLDIIIGSETNGQLYLYLGDGKDNFTLEREVCNFTSTAAIDAYDFDNDGNEDVVASVASTSSKAVYFIRGRGNGRFDEPQIVDPSVTLGTVLGISAPNAQPPGKPIPRVVFNQSAYVGETVSFNGSASTDPNDISVAAYNWSFGDGTYGSGATTTHAYSQNGVYQVNLTVTDTDGYLSALRMKMTVKSGYHREFIATANDSGMISLFLASPDGSFEAKSNISDIGSNVRGLAIADFDNDGDYDIIGAAGDGNIYLFTNDGTENFTRSTVGKSEVLSSAVNYATCGGVRILSSAGYYNNNAGGTWYTSGTVNYHPYNLIDGAKTTATNDYWLENDGSSAIYIDLGERKPINRIVLDNHNQHSTTCSYEIYYNMDDWNGTFAYVDDYIWSQVGSSAATGSLATNGEVAVTLNSTVWARYIRVNVTLTGGSYAVLNEIEVYQNFQPYGNAFGSSTSMDVAAADFNGDGYKDIALSGNDTKLKVLINDGDGGFNMTGELTLPSQLYAKAAADFTDDGNCDILVACRDMNAYLLAGTGTGAFTDLGSVIDLSADGVNDIFTLTEGDFNKDGSLDVIVGGDTGGQAFLYTGNLTNPGSFNYAGMAYNFSSTCGAGKAYDFDNDGKLDVFVTTESNNSLYRVRGYGDGSFRYASDRVVMPDLLDGAIGKALGIAVPDEPYPGKPAADAQGNKTGYNDTPMLFNGSSSINAAEYTWNFGDGNVENGSVVWHNYSRNGVYTATLTVRDGYGNSASQRITVTVKSNWRQEFVIVSNDAGEIYCFQSNGDGTFQNGTLVDDAGSNARGVCVADFDGDYDYDFIVGEYTGTTTKGEVFLYRNDGNQSFTRVKIATGIALTSNQFNDFASGDFNGDGYVDFLLSSNDTTVRVFLNNRDGTFTQSQAISASWEGARLYGKDVGDWNGDGLLDFAVGGYQNTNGNYGSVYIYAGNGNGTFTNYWYAFCATGENEVRKPYTLMSGDFDNDSFLDLIVGGDGDTNDDGSSAVNASDGRAYLYVGDGTGNFTYARPAYDFVDACQAGDSYDFDGDGYLDAVVVTDTNKSLFFVQGGQNGTFRTTFDRLLMPPLVNYSLGNVIGISAPNVPPVGKPRAAIADVPIGFANGTFTLNATSSNCSNGEGNFTWDFGDGQAAYGNTTSHVYASNGVYNVTLTVTDSLGYKAIARTKVIARTYSASEFIITSNNNGELYYFGINRNGTLSDGRLIGDIGSNTWGTSVADFDNDGDYDFVAGDGSGGALYMFINDGNNSFAIYKIATNYPSGTLTLASYSAAFAAGDLNDDGYPDFVTSGDNNVLRVFINNKEGYFNQSNVSVDSNSKLRAKAIADVNGDGALDVIAGDNYKNIYVFNGTSSGVFSSWYKAINLSSISLSANNVTTLACADFDGDGYADIIVGGGSSSGRVWLYDGDGTGNFTYVRQAYDFTTYAQAATAYDIDRDGYLDLTVVVYDERAIYLLRGGTGGMFYQAVQLNASFGSSNALGISAPPVANVPANLEIWGESRKSGFAGDTLTYNITIENNATAPDIIAITYASKYGYIYTVQKNVDGYLSALSDADGDGTIDTGLLPQNGGKISLTVTFVIPPGAPALVTDVLTLRATSGIDKITAKTLLTETEVKTTLKVSISASTLVQEGDAGSVLSYALTLKNDGNTPDVININISGNLWTAQLFASDGTTLLSNTNPGSDTLIDAGTVAANSTAGIILKIAIPQTPTALNDTLTLMAQSAQDNNKSATVSFTSFADPVMINSAAASKRGNRGDVLSFLLEILNNGNASVIDVPYTSTSGWPFSLSYQNGTLLSDTNGNGIADVGTLGKGAGVAIYANMTIPQGASFGSSDRKTVTAASVFGKTDSTSFTAVLNNANVAISAASSTASGLPSTNVTYNLVVNNLGDAPDVINIEKNSALGWVVQLYHANWSALSDTNDDGFVDVGAISTAGSAAFIAVANIPPGASPSVPNTIAVKAVSSVYPAVNSTVSLVAAALNYTGFDLGGNQSKGAFPGRDVFYSVIVRNDGNVKDVIQLGAVVHSLNWSAALFKNDYTTALEDTNLDGVLDTGELNPGYSLEIAVRLSLPYDAPGYSIERTVLTGTSTKNAQKTLDVELATTVNAVANISATPNKVGERVNVGAFATYQIDITNMGNIDDIIEVETNGTKAGWTVTLLDANGMPLSNTGGLPGKDAGAIASKSSGRIVVKIAAPSLGFAQSSDYIDITTVTLRSATEPQLYVSMAFNTSIRRYAAFDVWVAESEKNVRPGEVANYTLYVVNRGVNSDSIELLMTGYSWPTSITGAGGAALPDTSGNGKLDTGLIAPNDNFTLVVGVRAPEDALARAVHTIMLNLASFENASVSTTKPLSATVLENGTLDINAETAAYADPTDNVTRTIYATNSQNYEEDLGVRVSSQPNGWTAEVYDANWNRLTDTNLDGFLDAGALGMNQTMTLALVVNVPPSAAHDSVNTVQLTFNSAVRNESVKVLGFDITINAPALAIQETVVPESVYQDSIVSITVWVENTGAYAENVVVNVTTEGGAVLGAAVIPHIGRNATERVVIENVSFNSVGRTGLKFSASSGQNASYSTTTALAKNVAVEAKNTSLLTNDVLTTAMIIMAIVIVVLSILLVRQSAMARYNAWRKTVTGGKRFAYAPPSYQLKQQGGKEAPPAGEYSPYTTATQDPSLSYKKYDSYAPIRQSEQDATTAPDAQKPAGTALPEKAADAQAQPRPSATAETPSEKKPQDAPKIKIDVSKLSLDADSQAPPHAAQAPHTPPPVTQPAHEQKKEEAPHHAEKAQVQPPAPAHAHDALREEPRAPKREEPKRAQLEPLPEIPVKPAHAEQKHEPPRQPPQEPLPPQQTGRWQRPEQQQRQQPAAPLQEAHHPHEEPEKRPEQEPRKPYKSQYQPFKAPEKKKEPDGAAPSLGIDTKALGLSLSLDALKTEEPAEKVQQQHAPIEEKKTEDKKSEEKNPEGSKSPDDKSEQKPQQQAPKRKFVMKKT